MTREADRMARTASYVVGLMDEGGRTRAERDLDIDPGFREAVLRVAERMQLLDLKPVPEAAPGDAWRMIAARIAELPQMRSIPSVSSLPLANEATQSRANTRSPGTKPRRAGPKSAPDARTGMVVMGLIAPCATGYAAGIVTSRFW